MDTPATKGPSYPSESGRVRSCPWAGATDPIQPCTYNEGHNGPHSYMVQMPQADWFAETPEDRAEIAAERDQIEAEEGWGPSLAYLNIMGGATADRHRADGIACACGHPVWTNYHQACEVVRVVADLIAPARATTSKGS